MATGRPAATKAGRAGAASAQHRGSESRSRGAFGSAVVKADHTEARASGAAAVKAGRAGASVAVVRAVAQGGGHRGREGGRAGAGAVVVRAVAQGRAPWS
ncbi:hypothetical protein GCM10018962_89580 [Dactylosporangium matsuzakiense]|uniref:Uncharacterized protein n=1 Tax=Dactylosporangium matsuzakiense TaxID=53360 RepID=A0A9W6NLM3_9ACTN|nr:hypothetical protein GCM10017581_029990 [Dactylosporangium matsuzakiense]